MSSSSEIKSTFENFLIPFKELMLATNDFHRNNKIGDGGFGSVYEGQLSARWGNRRAAIKRRAQNSLQGKHEFETEILMVSKLKHRNIISFIGYCNEDDEMIIVYEYAIRGSLDRHLEDSNKRSSLTWMQRLKICLGAARGLEYLHSGLGEGHRVIHRDVKSSNILLDEDMEAKLSDFGLSRSGARNQIHTGVFTNVAGTSCYLDPVYSESGILTKESDVYSLGVVLFEMLSGMLAYTTKSIGGSRPLPLINLVRQNEDAGIDEIVDIHIADQINSQSFRTFVRIAYLCISFSSRNRPTMDTIIKYIEKAMELNMNFDEDVLKSYWKTPKSLPAHILPTKDEGSISLKPPSLSDIYRPILSDDEDSSH